MIVKKKKFHIGLDGMSWGALGDSANVPQRNLSKENPAMLKVKTDKERKWWSIGGMSELVVSEAQWALIGHDFV